MLPIVLWTVVGYLLGAIPFSVILGKMIVKKDVRLFGDGNPGGANAFKAGGAKTGIPAMLLDIGKGFLPVFLAQKYGVLGWGLVPVGLAPILGHAFSPFLRFRGGKALAATGGVWIALVGLWAFPIYAILALPLTLLQSEDAWSASGGMFALLGYTILTGESWLITFSALNTAIIMWTHRRDLVRPPHLRPWVVHLLSRRGA